VNLVVSIALAAVTVSAAANGRFVLAAALLVCALAEFRFGGTVRS
jgi:hypothetical protein